MSVRGPSTFFRFPAGWGRVSQDDAKLRAGLKAAVAAPSYNVTVVVRDSLAVLLLQPVEVRASGVPVVKSYVTVSAYVSPGLATLGIVTDVGRPGHWASPYA